MNKKGILLIAVIIVMVMGLLTFSIALASGDDKASAPPPPITGGGPSLACPAPTIEFENGIPGDWSVVDNEGNGVIWLTTGASGYPTDCEESNYTNGSGLAACVSSDSFGTADFDTELRSNVFSLVGYDAISLTYTANYQNFANEDFLDVDISTDGGTNWANLLSWNEDHGSFRATPGEDVTLDLTSYAGQSNLMLRWRYWDPAPNDFEWYAEIDDVALNCNAAPAPPEPLVCNGAPVAFEFGIPSDWTVADNEGNGVVWLGTGASGYPTDCGEGNYTNGSGEAACVSSDNFGVADFDTELWSNPINLTGWNAITLTYSANYQNFANEDFLDVDVSTDGGTNWTNLLSWNEDHGSFRSTPGEDVSLDLSAYANMSNVLVRWRYWDPAIDDWEWYAEIDDAAIACGDPLVPDIAIDKSPDTQTIVTGGNADFTITVTNTGDITLTNVTVGDALTPACDSALGTMGPGASTSYACSAIGVGASFTNTAVVTSTNGSVPGPSDSDDAYVEVVPPTSVSLSGFDGATGLVPSPFMLVALLVLIVGAAFAVRRKLTA